MTVVFAPKSLFRSKDAMIAPVLRPTTWTEPPPPPPPPASGTRSNSLMTYRTTASASRTSLEIVFCSKFMVVSEPGKPEKLKHTKTTSSSPKRLVTASQSFLGTRDAKSPVVGWTDMSGNPCKYTTPIRKRRL